MIRYIRHLIAPSTILEAAALALFVALLGVVAALGSGA